VTVPRQAGARCWLRERAAGPEISEWPADWARYIAPRYSLATELPRPAVKLALTGPVNLEREGYGRAVVMTFITALPRGSRCQ
jgi:hypothetical protein